MNSKYISTIAAGLNIRIDQVRKTAELLSEGCTIPFIARYRKEATGSLSEVDIARIRDDLEKMTDLDKRREAILKSLTERELLTPELERALIGAVTLSQIEDLYLPYRPKKKSRASVALGKGLAPLADVIFSQTGLSDLIKIASDYINTEKGVDTAEEALAGASDIIAEKVSESIRARSEMRRLFTSRGRVTSVVITGQEIDGSKYNDYFDYSEPARICPSHRILAMLRGEKEGILKLSFLPGENEAIARLKQLFVHGGGKDSIFVEKAAKDGYKRLLAPSMEKELKRALKTLADVKAVEVFADNVRNILMAPPLGKKRVLALDPGFRTGCKVVCLGAEGQLLHNETIYPHPPKNQRDAAEASIRKLVSDFGIQAIAIGNGTAGRETVSFIKSLDLDGIITVMVNESGASIYSASQAGRDEFPDKDITVRGAVSIGRRLLDPLAELVKIDPKSIGVGQYQHDVDQKLLKRSLDDVVLECVNKVGVDINTASGQLLAHISGLSPQLASNIVAFREGNGPFRTRNDFKKVPRLGPKAFEQSAGFLRITDGPNPLDASAVHPENYPIVMSMASNSGYSVAELIGRKDLNQLFIPSDYVTDKAGLPTITDILDELAKPGRDPRKNFDLFVYSDNITEIKDLKQGMILPGVVSNVTAFGAFVDIGVHHDGLIHISELSDTYVKDVNKVVASGQKVMAKVLDIDFERDRISLSMKGIKQEKRKNR